MSSVTDLTYLFINFRLLYSNLDFTREEQLLVEIILNTNYNCHSSNESDISIVSPIDERLDLFISR